jgi:hypothetical protein
VADELRRPRRPARAQRRARRVRRPHLLRHNTGLGAQCALFELHHCDNTPAQREALIAKVKLDMEAVTAEMKAAQPGVAKRYREHNNDQQRLSVCACCGERNKDATGKYTRMPLRYKQVSVSREKLTAAAVFEPHGSTLNDKTAQERGMCRGGSNVRSYMQTALSLAPRRRHGATRRG